MKKTFVTALSIVCVLALLSTAALAETLTLNGSVAAGSTVEVYAPIGGTVASVAAEVGQEVGEDDVLCTLKTTKVYAEENGKVTGIFGEPGDSADTVVTRYGGVMYLEGESVYSVSASTDSAYNSTANKFVHVGEKVYLQCRTNADRSGEGTITAIEGTSYTVKVTGGAFIPGDSVDVFRNEKHSNAQKIGRGTVSRVAPTAVSASGAIVRIAVEDGAEVKRGDLLLETLDGSFDGLYMSGVEILAGQKGVIGSLNMEQGSAIQKNGVVAVIYPLEGMRVEALVSEENRSDIKAGDPVTIELEADETITYTGTVTMVSSVAEAGEGEVNYKVLISFTPDEHVRYGMKVLVTTAEKAQEEESIVEEPEEEVVENEAEGD